ncbi:hypothetical protein GUJ93_ZPchr0982g33666 [Zizania palustris]|uniref:Rab GDP dissociation inhibitor n=1 Tax=Zizania palustris TaxID=103762 RepID=A0A8J5QPZ5_ZIZPA|nr:hypothetical protein GUJ93_ZPchr0982g33666 [Zizania palustris]
MDEEYDVIVLGTGLKSAILSGLSPFDGLKVRLLTDRPLSLPSAASPVAAAHRRFVASVLGFRVPPRGIGSSPRSSPSTAMGWNAGSLRHAKYGLSDDDTVDFIGHALALHRDDRYLNEPAIDTVKRMKVSLSQSFGRWYPICESLARFQGGSLIFYPLYGLGELPQGFARLSAVYGGTYMLNKPDCKVEFDMEGKVCGVTSEDIFATKQLGRKSDMYVFCCSYTHNVAPKGKFIAFVSTEAESDNPQYEPVNEPSLDNCFVSMSYDATTHFETTVTDVLNMYTMITGKTVDLSVDLSAASAAEEY